jgi:hypothetical protein
MGPAQDQKVEWKIDRVLKSLSGKDVRVLGRSFLPGSEGTRREKLAFISTDDLFLPDNQRTDGFPVLFEGRLEWFERRVGVVFVGLNSSDFLDSVSDGFTPFRGKLAVIIRGPVIVELKFPFSIELLPFEAENYWRDLRFPSAQLEFPFKSSR